MTKSAKPAQQPAVGKARRAVPTKLVEATGSAYGYPLLIKNLLHTARRHAPDQEIVYRDVLRYDYRTLEQRIGRLANGLASLRPPGERSACWTGTATAIWSATSPSPAWARCCTW